MRLVFIFLFCFCSSLNSHGQNIKHSYFFGINPSITIEPYYAKGEFDINILPFVIQKTISTRSDIRLISLVNLCFRQIGNRISHIGLSGGWVYYLSPQEENLPAKYGCYLAPVVDISHNRIENSINTGLYAETGYQFKLRKNWGITTGLQLGYTHFTYASAANKWKPHFGIKVIIGKWIHKK